MKTKSKTTSNLSLEELFKKSDNIIKGYVITPMIGVPLLLITGTFLLIPDAFGFSASATNSVFWSLFLLELVASGTLVGYFEMKRIITDEAIAEAIIKTDAERLQAFKTELKDQYDLEFNHEETRQLLRGKAVQVTNGENKFSYQMIHDDNGVGKLVASELIEKALVAKLNNKSLTTTKEPVKSEKETVLPVSLFS